MSTPRVGWAATSSAGSAENSRATITFCMLPPDSERIGASAPAARMSYFSINWVACVRSAAGERMPRRVKGGWL
jgi:hypothetical protein